MQTFETALYVSTEETAISHDHQWFPDLECSPRVMLMSLTYIHILCQYVSQLAFLRSNQTVLRNKVRVRASLSKTYRSQPMPS